jgi:hypothetical protein
LSNTPAVGTQDAQGALTDEAATEQMLGLLSTPEDQEADSPPEPTETESEAPDEEADETEDAEEAPAENDADDEEDAPEEPPQPKTFKVKVDDQELEVTEDELLKGYSRTADYTRKTQALAAARKEFEEVERPKLHETLTQYEARLTQLAQELDTVTEPDWDQVRADKPAEFATLWAEWDRYKKQQAAVKQEHQKVAEQRMELERQEFVKYVAQEKDRLLSVIPEWKDGTVAKQETADIRAFALNLGFTEAELDAMVDHRAVVALRKAMLYEKRQQKAPAVKDKLAKATPKATPTARPAAAPATKRTKDALERLKKTGRDEDAVAALEGRFA